MVPAYTPSVLKCLSLENRVSLTDTFSGRLTLRDRVVLMCAAAAASTYHGVGCMDHACFNKRRPALHCVSSLDETSEIEASRGNDKTDLPRFPLHLVLPLLHVDWDSKKRTRPARQHGRKSPA
jgi:hypothetical protein